LIVGKTIMVVDDSATMRSLVSSYVAELGDYETVEAASGFEALKLLPTKKIDLIITDINMPDINGLELINFVKSSSIYSHIPMIIITTERGEADRQRGLSLGAREYIVKPFSSEEIRAAVETIFNKTGDAA
jgi:two-component system, chemotaxis family, chemotaxis protein CheY